MPAVGMLAMKVCEPKQPKELWMIQSKGQLRALGSSHDLYVEEELKFMTATLPNVYNFGARTVKQQKARH